MDKLLSLIAGCLLSSATIAGTIPFVPEAGSQHVKIDGSCAKSAMTINNMVNLTDNSLVSPLPVSATDCYAVTAPDNDFSSNYGMNTGGLYEGMLNGESKRFNGKNGTTYHVNPNLFLDNPNDRWFDENTPGWISLAEVNGAEEDKGLAPFARSYSSIGGVSLSQLFTIDFGIENGMGFWSIDFIPNAGDVIKEVERLLKRPTRFDHLAFVLKGANKQDWYMYDFSFWDLMDDQNLSIDLNDPHNISGTWNPNLFFGGQQVSHIQILAHDPPPPSNTDVPEPKGLFILFSGLALLLARRRT